MRARPSLVALLALSRRIQVAAGVPRVRLSGSALNFTTSPSRGLPFVAPPCASASNVDRRRRFQNARLLRLALRSARAVRPSAASAPSRHIDAEEPSTVVLHPASSVLRSCAAPRVRPVKRQPCGSRCAHCYALPPKVNARSLLAEPWPNPSIEGTSNIRLRLLSAAPHVKR
jgi:hypothetical protein